MNNPIIIKEIEKRVIELNTLFPKEKVTVEKLIEKILIKYLKNQQNKIDTTASKEWILFRRKNAKKIWQQAKCKCFYCLRSIPFHQSTIDHKHPVGRGGELLNPDNLVIACKWCNSDKDILTDEEYFYKQLHNAAKGIKPE